MIPRIIKNAPERPERNATKNPARLPNRAMKNDAGIVMSSAAA